MLVRVAGATITPPSGVVFDGPISSYVYPDERHLDVPNPDDGYIEPGEGSRVQEGWWTVETASGKQAAFQMDAAQIFDSNGALRILIPKIEFAVTEEPRSIKLWRANTGGLEIGETINLTDIPDTSFGSNHFHNLQILEGLTISWYLYDPLSDSYKQASEEFIKLALGYVGISVAPQWTGAPGRYKTQTEVGDTHEVMLYDDGNTTYQYLEVIEGKEDYIEPVSGYDEWTQATRWKEFTATSDLSANGTFVWNFPNDFRYYFSPANHRFWQQGDPAPVNKHFQVNNRESQSYSIIVGEGDNIQYWNNLPDLIPLGEIHINYSMQGVNLRFSFGKDQ